jgi:hypothetical protein
MLVDLFCFLFKICALQAEIRESSTLIAIRKHIPNDYSLFSQARFIPVIKLLYTIDKIHSMTY